MLEIGASAYPALWDVVESFAEVHGELSTYLTAKIPTGPTLAVRVGGKKIWGLFPFQESAFVGGWHTVRGFGEQRFAGDASVYGNAELRLDLIRSFSILWPARFGIVGLFDVGRVFLDQCPSTEPLVCVPDPSNTWHVGYGGGIWFTFLSRDNVLSISVARSVERTGLYLRSGFVF